MEQELEKYYENLFEMFSTPGWKHFEEKAQELLKHHREDGWGVPNEDLLTNKGMILNLLWVTGFQEAHERAYGDILAQENTSGEETEDA